MKTHRYFYFLLILISIPSFAQQKWWNPAEATFPVIEGRAWQTDLVRPYDRLPAKAEKTVRQAVWSLGQNTAGEYIRFTTDATEITVRYQISKAKSLDHMPATGVSGVDLYALDMNNNWQWVRGAYSFGDTVQYKFTNVVGTVPIKEFRLYLPLYNIPKWMQIGVGNNKTFKPIQVSNEQPLVLYGTSIMQGACASRPGLAWTNILGRKLNVPIINLGFSGNGKLEQPVIDLMNETNARLFVLDCQPNLVDKKTYPEADIQNRIRTSVKSLQAKHPDTPILLVEHCDGVQEVEIDSSVINRFRWTSDVLNKTYVAMKKEGVKNIYLLTAKEIGFDSSSTVDGTHPTDIGMMKYADAYEKTIRGILGNKGSRKK
ncbi:SGNH/GDSL hydrolase family protein [Emticicia fontis]